MRALVLSLLLLSSAAQAAVVSRVTTVVVSGATGSRTWVSTAAAQDTAAGSSVVITTTVAFAGASPPAQADTLSLRVTLDDASTVVITFTLTPGSASQTSTYHFTSTGASGGASRCGTLEMILRATKTTGGPTNTYDVESDGAPNTPPTGFTTTQADRGWIRGTTTATVAVSNASLGGAKTTPFAYPESIFVRATLGAASYLSRAMVNTFSGATPALTNTPSATQVFDSTFTTSVDNRFAAALNTQTAATAVSGNATLTGVAWTVLSSNTSDTASVDPRLTVAHLFQIDDNTYGTPPLSKNVASGLRLVSQGAYLASRWQNARSVGQNGLTWTMTLTPVNPGTTITATGVVSATKGGEPGWSTDFTAWTSSLPGGTWNKATTITAPAGAVGTTYVLNSTAAYSLVAPDPNLQPACFLNDNTTVGDHASAGHTLQLVASLVDVTTGIRKTPSSVSFFASHYNIGNSTLEYLTSTSDNTGAAFAAWGAATPATLFSLSALGGDTTLYAITLSATAGWGAYPVVVRCQVNYQGVAYKTEISRELPGTFNPHSANKFDGTDFATGFPSK